MSIKIKIKPCRATDNESLWQIFKEVANNGDAFMQDESCTYEEWLTAWFTSNSKVFVAHKNNEVIGAYVLKPNQPGRGRHIANGSYMVASKARGQRIGKTLGEHSIKSARELGFSALQFNAVVSTNDSAISIWKSLGFEIIGRIPKGFNHIKYGLVDTFVMFREI